MRTPNLQLYGELPKSGAVFMVKIQRSITPPGKILIYDQARRFQMEGYLGKKRVREFMGDELKIYAFAQVTNGKLDIIEQTEGENW